MVTDFVGFQEETEKKTLNDVLPEERRSEISDQQEKNKMRFSLQCTEDPVHLGCYSMVHIGPLKINDTT